MVKVGEDQKTEFSSWFLVEISQRNGKRKYDDMVEIYGAVSSKGYTRLYKGALGAKTLKLKIRKYKQSGYKPKIIDLT